MPDSRRSAAAAVMYCRRKILPIAQMWIGFPVTAIAASLSASEWVGWAWQV